MCAVCKGEAEAALSDLSGGGVLALPRRRRRGRAPRGRPANTESGQGSLRTFVQGSLCFRGRRRHVEPAPRVHDGFYGSHSFRRLRATLRVRKRRGTAGMWDDPAFTHANDSDAGSTEAALPAEGAASAPLSTHLDIPVHGPPLSASLNGPH